MTLSEWQHVYYPIILGAVGGMFLGAVWHELRLVRRQLEANQSTLRELLHVASRIRDRQYNLD